MPELPEAETLARGLRPLLPGSRIERTRVLHADVLRQPERDFRDAVRHRTITAVERRAKKIVLALDDGAVFLIVNLGMTGGLFPLGGTPEGGEGPERFARPPTHPAIRFHFEDRRALVYHDIRRFGSVEALDPDAWAARSEAIGPEPLADDFTPDRLHAGLSRSRSPVRNWLLDQRRIAGVGNIYASEACFRARLHPARPAASVTPTEAARLHAGLREVLSDAIEHGGTTLRDYRNAEGRPGLFGSLLQVYGRDGEPCTACGATLERSVFGARSAFHCPSCQPRPPEARDRAGR
ncbi:MAG: bifunctional DNA-formamidopyrimidine glycosylase/DNA-(apurinic or apyrimidinic site) lyase [Longimicrobiales bacterium]|nr:bifunctional DNA-formamidopyrimidine glycosylase/DNA-(apurinic or apyrimidinic site) lyase [Longimicrobiales bacterium]